MKKIYLDTNIFIYIFEDHPEFKLKFINFYNNTKAHYYTSSFSLGELLVNAYKNNRQDLADLYRSNVADFVKKIIVIDETICDQYARIRASHPKISRPDALHIASATSCCDTFLTNDKQLLQISLPNIKFVGLN